MNQVTTLQHLEYLETGFEVSKRLAQAGYRMGDQALSIIWGEVAEVIARTLVDYGISPDRLDDEQYLEIVQSIQLVFDKGDESAWREMVQLSVTSNAGVLGLLEPPDPEPDEGPLTERYENATRLGDDEGFWPDAGASADLFDDF